MGEAQSSVHQYQRSGSALMMCPVLIFQGSAQRWDSFWLNSPFFFYRKRPIRLKRKKKRDKVEYEKWMREKGKSSRRRVSLKWWRGRISDNIYPLGRLWMSFFNKIQSLSWLSAETYPITPPGTRFDISFSLFCLTDPTQGGESCSLSQLSFLPPYKLHWAQLPSDYQSG